MKKTIDNKLFHNGVLKVKKSKEEHLLESLYEKRSGFKTLSKTLKSNAKLFNTNISYKFKEDTITSDQHKKVKGDMTPKSNESIEVDNKDTQIQKDDFHNQKQSNTDLEGKEEKLIENNHKQNEIDLVNFNLDLNGMNIPIPPEAKQSDYQINSGKPNEETKENSQERKQIEQNLIADLLPSNKENNEDLENPNITDVFKSIDLISNESPSNKLRTSRAKAFTERMWLDFHKRQSKVNNVNSSQNTKRMNELKRIETFNRLIDDANRRLEAREKLQATTNQLNEVKVKQKMTKEQWDETYNERFISFKEKKDRRIKEKRIEQEEKLKREENILVQSIKESVKKLPQFYLNTVAQRLYQEAVRRQIVQEERDSKIKMFEAKRVARKTKISYDDIEKVEPDYYKMKKRAKREIKSKAAQKEVLIENKINKNLRSSVEEYNSLDNEGDKWKKNGCTENEEIKLNEIKNGMIKSNNSPLIKQNTRRYLPDFVAGKLVEDLLRDKLLHK